MLAGNVSRIVQGQSIDFLYRARRYAEAEAALSKYIESWPKDSWAHCKLARVYLKLEDGDKAIAAATRAMAVAPDDADSCRVLAWAFHLTRQPERATPLAREALRLRPADVENYNLLAWILAVAGDYPQCREIVERGLGLDPRHEGLWAAHARALMSRREWAKAVPLLHKALEFGCGRFFNSWALSVCYYHLKHYDRAEELLAGAMRANPHHPSAQDLHRELRFRRTPQGRLIRLLFRNRKSFLPD